MNLTSCELEPSLVIVSSLGVWTSMNAGLSQVIVSKVALIRLAHTFVAAGQGMSWLTERNVWI